MDKEPPSKFNTTIRVAISLLVLFAALFVILSQRYPDDYAKWAFGIIGIVVGYWLRLRRSHPALAPPRVGRYAGIILTHREVDYG